VLTLRLMAAAFLLLLGAAACSSPAMTDELIMDEFEYRPVDIRVPADTPDYELTLTNVGSVPHDFTVEGLPEDILVHLAILEGGSAPYRLPALPEGEYTVYCALEGHREEGMEATLRVG